MAHHHANITIASGEEHALTTPNFRAARATDIPTILALIEGGAAVPSDFPPIDPTDPCYLAAFRAIEADSNQNLIVMEQSAEIIGVLQISFIPGISHRGGWRGLIENVHVRADQRGKGTGTKMMQHAIKLCSARGCFLVQLTSNKLRNDAHRFYNHLGFEASHEGFKLHL